MHDSRLKDEWSTLITAMRAALDLRISPREAAVQRLARHWVDLLRRTSIDDPELLHDYDGSQRLESDAPLSGEIESELLDYLSAALWARHLTLDESARLRTNGPKQRAWPRVLGALRDEMNCGASVMSPAVQKLYRQWEDGLDELTAGDDALRRKWMTAVRSDPALLATNGIDPRLQNYLRRAHLVKEMGAAMT